MWIKFFDNVVETALGIAFVLLQLVLTATVVSVLWDWIGPRYFDFLPAKYLAIPWFHMIVIVYFLQHVGSILFRNGKS